MKSLGEADEQLHDQAPPHTSRLVATVLADSEIL